MATTLAAAAPALSASQAAIGGGGECAAPSDVEVDIALSELRQPGDGPDGKPGPSGDVRALGPAGIAQLPGDVRALAVERGGPGRGGEVVSMGLGEGGRAEASTMEAAAANHIEISKAPCVEQALLYSAMPAELQRALRELDAEGKGHVTLEQLRAAAGALRRVRWQNRLARRSVVCVCFAVVLLLAGVFFLAFLAAESAKDVRVSRAGVLISIAGQPVKTSSADFEVSPSGTLVRGNCTGLAGECPAAGPGENPAVAAVLATQTARLRLALRSSLPDAYLRSLQEISVYSDLGHAFQVKVAAFSRIPVLNSRCGNIVTFYTPWNGRIVLDDTDLSFDPEMEKMFKGAGFSVAVGGAAGRRLQSQYSLDGFFDHVAAAAGAGHWNCTDVPLPRRPAHFRWATVGYSPCRVGAGGLSACDSRFGGRLPGAGPLPEAHALASMSKAAQIRMFSGLQADPRTLPFSTSQDTVINTSSYLLQLTRLPNHPGQQKVSFYNRKTKQEVQFQQFFLGNDTLARHHCRAGAEEPSSPEDSEALNRTAAGGAELHFEFVGLVEEGGTYYRHFRVTDAALMDAGADGGAQDPGYFEYWDRADDLAAYRLLTPDGYVHVVEGAEADWTDNQVEQILAAMGLTPETAAQCGGATAGDAAPHMVSAALDLSEQDAAFYRGFWGALGEPGNAAWEAAFGPARDYLRREGQADAMYDSCSAACSGALQAYRRGLASGDACPDLLAAVACLQEQGPPCAATPFFLRAAGAYASCQAQAQRRRLRSREETSMFDGGAAVELGALAQADQGQLAKLLNISEADVARARLVWDGTSSADETVLAGGARPAARRLQGQTYLCNPATMNLPWFSPAPASDDFKIGVASDSSMCLQFMCDCDGQTPKVPECVPGCNTAPNKVVQDGSLTIKVSVTTGMVGAQLAGGLDASLLGVRPPFWGTIRMGGSAETLPGSCGGIPFSLTSNAWLEFDLGLNLLNIAKLDLLTLQVALSASCQSQDLQLAGEATLQLVPIRRSPLQLKTWAKAGYSVSSKRFSLVVSAEYRSWLTGGSWVPLSGCPVTLF